MSNDVAIQQKANKVRNLLEQMKPQMALALPKHISVDRMARIALTEFRKTPALHNCDPTSFVAAVMLSGQLGLEVGPLGHAYLIPYKAECTFMLGYKGMLELARRSGFITSLTAHVVYEKDKFEYAFGLEDKLIHQPCLGDAGKVIAAYAVAKLKDGSHQFEVMSKTEIDKIRDGSPAKGSIPWTKHYDEMAKKTVIRRLFKYLPVSIEMQNAIAYDDKVESGGTNVIELLKENSDIELPDDFNVKPAQVDGHLNSLIANKKGEIVDMQTGEVTGLPEVDVTDFFEGT